MKSGATVGQITLDRQNVRSYCPDMTLRELRTQAGKSRARVAGELEMSERHLYRLEHGVTPLSRALALLFADYYGVPVDEIDEAPARPRVAA